MYIAWRFWLATVLSVLLFSCGGGGLPTEDVTVSLRYSPPPGSIGTNYSYAPDYHSNQSVSEHFEIAGGSLPPGLGISAGDGVISGVPTAAGTYSFTVKLSVEGAEGSVSATATITITGNRVGLVYSPPGGTVGQTYNYTPSFSSGQAINASFSATGLPLGLKIDQSTGALSGIPTTAGSYQVNVSMSASGFSMESRQLSIIIVPSSQGPGVAACSPSEKAPASSMTNDSIVEIPFHHSTRAVVYDKGRNVFYATTPSSAPTHSNRIAVISADTGAISYSSEIGSDPGALAIAKDCSSLYVYLKGSNEVVRVALPSLTINGRITLGSEVTLVGQIDVSPLSPETFIITTWNNRAPTTRAHLYTNMVEQAEALGEVINLAFDSTGNWAYGYSFAGSVIKAAVSPTTIKVSEKFSANPTGVGNEFTFVDDLLMSWGYIFSITTMKELGHVDGSGCTKLPSVDKVVCVTERYSTQSPTSLTIADPRNTNSIYSDLVIITKLPIPNGQYARVINGAKGQVAVSGETKLLLVKNGYLN